MNVDLELYRIFYVVAKNKHMTRASEELCISQPAISQSIKKLEEQLGGTLFIRSNKGMELTKEGEMFFDYIKGALDLITSAENEFTSFKNLDKGVVRIGISTTLTKLVLMDTVEEFHKLYPNVEINIVNGLTDNLLLDLEKGKIDFVIFNEGLYDPKIFLIDKLCSLKEGFIYNKKYFKDNTKVLDDINNYSVIIQNSNSNSRKVINEFLLKKGIILKPKMEVVSQDLVVEFTESGLGVGYTIIDLAKKNYPDLEELEINKFLPDIDILVASNKNIVLPFASKEFMSILYKNKGIEK